MAEEKRGPGRPPTGQPLRNKTLTVRLLPEELERLAAYSEKQGKTMTQVVLESIKDYIKE